MGFESRTREIKKASSTGTDGPVVYWMSRDQRIFDNWALISACEIALKSKKPLIIVFCLRNNFLNATFRHYKFMLEGLSEIQKEAEELNIPFVLLSGDPENKIPDFVSKADASCLITDFDPVKIKNEWKVKVSAAIKTGFYEVDAHNIVPCWTASGKQEYGAYTLRPKIKRMLPAYLTDFPTACYSDYLKASKKFQPFFITEKIKSLIDNETNALKNSRIELLGFVARENSLIAHESDMHLKSGSSAALKRLEIFIDKKIRLYDKFKNDPNKDVTSGLSPYIHFGQISAQRIVLEINKSGLNDDIKESFLEELIVRRELADNYCFYNKDYGYFKGLPEWSKNSLNVHRFDKRPYLYQTVQFENAETHDELWNAAQMQMVKTGKMHGYMRMYWAKKILEWCRHPEEALEIAIYLNDKYSLDGRDSNGYAGIAWSIGGLHDRPWGERSIFGKIRYMNYSGCKKKFNINSYVESINKI